MVQFLSIIFFSWISSILGGFSKVPIFLCHSVYGYWWMPDTRTQDNTAIPVLGTYIKRNQTLQKNNQQKE